MGWIILALLITTTPAWAQNGARASIAFADEASLAAVTSLLYPAYTYAGRDADGVPRYTERPFSREERRLLWRHFGIEEPGRLYLSDSTPHAYLVYDTERDPGASRLVRSYRVGGRSVRRPGETWEQLERRLATMEPGDFPASVRKPDTSLAQLHPVARPAFERMLKEARRAGHAVRVIESHRSAERQAYLLVSGGRLTFTATSMHSTGRAVDVVIGNGNLKNRKTRARWSAFREWVQGFESGRFRIIGEPGRSWDWPHVELAGGAPGYRSVEEVLEAARRAESSCCDPSRRTLHSTHDPARRGAASLVGPRGDGSEVRVDGAAGGAAVSAR